MIKQASCLLPSESAAPHRLPNQERVIYFSFSIPASLRKLFSDPKSDRRIQKIESASRCLFRLSSTESPHCAWKQLPMVEAFLDQQLGSFDSCVSMLKTLLGRAGSRFVLYRAIKLNTCQDGSYEYMCYSAAPAPAAPITMAPSNDQTDSALSGISTASSSVSQLFSDSKNVVVKSYESLAAFVSLEASVGRMDEIVTNSFSSVIDAMFFEAITSELSAEIWRFSLQRASADLVQSVTSQLVGNCCTVNQAVSQLSESLLGLTPLIKQICLDIMGDNHTVMWSSTEMDSNYSVVKSICTEFCRGSVEREDATPSPSVAESSANSVSELLFDNRSSMNEAESSVLPPRPTPRVRASVGRQFALVMSGALLDALFNDCCSAAAEEVCLDALVELVTQRLIQSLHNSSNTDNQFECRVLKAVARFNSVLRIQTSVPDLAGVVNKFFSCVVDSLANPDSISTGQVTGLVSTLQTSPLPGIDHQSSIFDWGGWQLLRVMREAFERAVCDQMLSLGGKLQRHTDAIGPKQLGDAFATASDVTSIGSNSLASEASEKQILPLKNNESELLLRTAPEREDSSVCLEQVSECTQLELDCVMGDLEKNTGLVRNAAVYYADEAVGIAVWQGVAPIKCESLSADGQPSETCLPMAQPFFGLAGVTSFGCIVAGPIAAVNSEVGPALHTCYKLGVRTCVSTLISQNLLPGFQLIAQFTPASINPALLLRRSTCLQRPQHALNMATPVCSCRSQRAAPCKQSTRYARCGLQLFKAAESRITALSRAAAYTVRVQSSQGQSFPLFRMVMRLHESAHRLEIDNWGVMIAKLEITSIWAACLATPAMVTLSAAETSKSALPPMRTPALIFSQKICGHSEPTGSSWRMSTPESALALLTSDLSAPALHDDRLCECGWAKSFAARLRPVLAVATAEPLARASESAHPICGFSNASGCMPDVYVDSDTLSTLALGGYSSFDSSLAVCWSGPDLATVIRQPIHCSAVKAPCPALRCSSADKDACSSKSATSEAAAAASSVPASAALTVVADTETESGDSVPAMSRQKRQRRSSIRLLSRSQRGDSAADADTRKLLRLLVERQAQLDRLLAAEVTNSMA